MRTLVGIGLVLAAVSCLGPIATAAGTGTSGVKVVRLHAPIEALAMSGNRVAYDLQSTPLAGNQGETPNRVYVWNVAGGATTKVSGRRTAGADGMAIGGVAGLAIAGTRVAWRVIAGSNEETDDDVYSSSSLAPKQRRVAGAARFGDQCGAGIAGPTPACAGTWLGGVVASGKKILVNRWTTDTSGAITGGGLYTLRGTTLVPFVTDGTAVEAVAADANRIAVQAWHWYDPDPTINVFSASGNLLSTVTSAVQPRAVALSGRNLVVLAPRKLVVYDAQTGALRTTLTLFRGRQADAIAVKRDIVVYSTAASRRANSVRALSLRTGLDRFIGRLPGRIEQLSIDSHGLVYANNYWSPAHGYEVELVFRPFAQVAAAVR